jgi:aspartyl-tRNA(Asn)/glutamyl-tRNA(Gln) amidotransferase subunit A
MAPDVQPAGAGGPVPTGLWARSAAELSGLLERREVSPREIWRAFRSQQERLNPGLNAIVTPPSPRIEQELDASERRHAEGKRLSPLDGIPVTVKDNIFVAGMRCTWGSRLFEDFVPERDDVCVERLRLAGALIAGKTNTPELALAARTDNLVFGSTRNPWDTALTPGGSSGGAVASVAAGMVPLAIGTDAGGSIRSPASFTGLVGLRPSNGRIARCHGFLPMANDFQAIGLLSRTVQDMALLYAVVAGSDPRDPGSMRLPAGARAAQPGSVRIRFVSDSGGEPVESAVRAGVRAGADALARLGYQVEEGPLPYDLEDVRAVWGVLSSVGAARVAQGFEGWRDRVGNNILALAEQGSKVTGTEYVRALDRLARIRAQASTAWEGFDVLLCPTSPVRPWPHELPHPTVVDGRPGHARSGSVFTTWVNAVGHPAVSLPTQPSADGLPVGMQLVGSFAGEQLLLDIAARFEAVRPWAHRWPRLAAAGP